LSSTQMQSRAAVSASRAKEAMSGRAMPAGKGLGTTTPTLTIEVLLSGLAFAGALASLPRHPL
jgi:hypothetical protein